MRFRLAPVLDRIFGDGGAAAEPFSDLAGEIIARHLDLGRRGLAICGPTQGDGVSFTAATLGLALANMGIGVLVVDANLRQPSLHDMIRPSGDIPPTGLLNLLRDESDARSPIISDVAANLSVLYAGGRSDTPQDLFDKRKFAELAAEWMRDYELTIVDTPPASRSAETRSIAAAVGYAVVVARRNHTFAEDVSALVRDLVATGVQVVGSVFNAE